MMNMVNLQTIDLLLYRKFITPVTNRNILILIGLHSQNKMLCLKLNCVLQRLNEPFLNGS